jgi:hypothetical protein
MAKWRNNEIGGASAKMWKSILSERKISASGGSAKKSANGEAKANVS